MDEPQVACCAVCGEEIRRQPWLGMSQWGVGTGTNSYYVQETDEDGEAHFDPDNRRWTAVALCWPVCAGQYIDATMAECDVVCRQGEG